MIKRIISKAYHKYVCSPKFDPHTTEEEYLEVCKEEYYLRKFYEIDTFEKMVYINKLATINFNMKNYNSDET